MIIPVDKNMMRTLSGNEIIAKACSDLSALGVDNFIHWRDEISVDIAGESHSVMIDYVAGGVCFVHPDCIECNE